MGNSIHDRLRRYRTILIIAIAVVAMAAVHVVWLFYFSTSSFGEITKGELDLRDWDPDNGQTLMLDGEWMFYPQALLQSEPEKQAPEPVLLQVPGSWESAVSGGSYKSYGYGTYKLALRVQPGEEHKFALRIPSVLTSSTLYVNGNRAGGEGRTSSAAERSVPFNVPYTAQALPNGEGIIELMLEVSNYHFQPSGGIELPVQFGEQSVIEGRTRLSELMQQIVFTAFILHALYAAHLYFMGIRNTRMLYLAALLLMITVALAGNNDKLLFHWFPLTYEWDFRLKGVSLAIGGIAAIHCSVHRTESRLFRMIKSIITGAGILLLVYSLVMPYPVSARSYLLFPLFIGISSISSLTAMLKLQNNWVKQNLYLWLLLASLFSSILREYALMYMGINAIFYPVDLLISIFCISSLMFRNHLQVANSNKTLAAKLQQEDKIKDEFLAHTSHELRNPLHGILNLSHSVLERESNRLDDKSIRDLQGVLSIGRRMNILLGDLLDASRLKDSGIQLYKQPLDLHAIAEKTLDSLQFLAVGKPIKLVNDVPSTLRYIHADENRLTQILFNLLHNAVKYTPEGTVIIGVAEHSDDAEIYVADTGIGINSDRLESIFEPYRQEAMGDSAHNVGFGLGLSICKKLVELHDSQLSVQSSLGGGSTFRFHLPFAAEAKRTLEGAADSLPASLLPLGMPDNQSLEANEAAVEKDRIEASNLVAASMEGIGEAVHEDNENSIAVLAVDDDPYNLQVIANLLSMDGGIDVCCTTSPLEALEKLPLRKWDLVISDVLMPEMSGYALTSLIRESFDLHELPVLLLTARNRPEDVEAGLLAGASDYIAKPVNAVELRARVHMLVRLKRSVRERLNMEAAWLQAQIKPHFVMNTLNSIVALSTVDNDRMIELVNEFSVYLRASYEIHNTGQHICLAQEMGLVKAYVRIEQERFGERLNVTWDVDDQLELLIPPLIIQPLVENAVTHGVLSRSRGGTVHIAVQESGNSVLFKIVDDGTGMSEDQIRLILGGKAGSGVGLHNTHLRIRQINGKGLSISSRPGVGTSVSFVLPKI